jgi:hypothetical protein
MKSLGQILFAFFGGLLLLSGCSKSNNLLLGKVEATVGGHDVVITDCYGTSVPKPEQLPDGGGKFAYHWMPCRNDDVVVTNDVLIVNGTTYEKLKQGMPSLLTTAKC